MKGWRGELRVNSALPWIYFQWAELGEGNLWITQILGEGQEEQRLWSSSFLNPAFDARPAEGLSFLRLWDQPLESETSFLIFSQNSQCCSLCLFPWLFPVPYRGGSRSVLSATLSNGVTTEKPFPASLYCCSALFLRVKPPNSHWNNGILEHLLCSCLTQPEKEAPTRVPLVLVTLWQFLGFPLNSHILLDLSPFHAVHPYKWAHWQRRRRNK